MRSISVLTVICVADYHMKQCSHSWLFALCIP